ncbi:DUF1542 domain-containing protein [Fructobacillus sp. M1-13]|uniref:DUF1542 domain-containing protein n=1 Tax=Fructobacillus papyriferae TaxID=2713171 RepID=A0ABS5QS84_9LACO|nr:DUF1542 domain-containing protein [Fructobacillus papyriferae]MBS9334827.1 DUF1542 domain-containing protein [Fructobacillus papyriferae]MCD2158817.1 DUF1542 domain-containing protein [Fructobacillus papyriferae]
MLKNQNQVQAKEHVKMYEAGKKWLFAGIIGLTIGAGAQGVATGLALPHYPAAMKVSADDVSLPYWFGQSTDYFKHYKETPETSTVPESEQDGWLGKATGKEVDRVKSETTFTFDGLTYNSETKKFTMSLTFTSPQITTSGAGRVSYFDLAFSNSMSKKTSNTVLTAVNHNNTTTPLSSVNGVYSNSFVAGGAVGGVSKLTIDIDPVKITNSDQISGMYSSDTNTINNHVIFSSVRTLGYNDFGKLFNEQLLDQMKKNSNANIDDKKNLTNGQKTDFHNEVNNTGTDSDFVNGLNGIDNNVNNADDAAGKANAAKDGAKADVDRAAQTADNTIDGLNIPQTDKDNAKKQVEADRKAADSNIDNATTTDGVNNAKNAGIKQINGNVPSEPTGPTQADKDKAKAAIDNAADAAKKKIDGLNLPQADKDKEKQKIDDDASKAKGNIDNATDTDGLNKAQSDGEKNINSDGNKASDKSAINDEADKKKAEIDANGDIPANDKDAAKKAIDNDADNAKKNIDNAANDNDADSATTNGKKAIDDDANKAADAGKAKAAAKAAIDNAADAAKKKIDGLNLPQADKDKEKQKIDDDASKAKGNIDNATDTDGVNKAQSDGENNINTDGNKASDKSAINDEADKKKAEIDANGDIPADDKAAAKKAIDNDADNAKKNIDNASNDNDADSATTNGKKAIDDDAENAKDTDKAKADAKADIDRHAQDGKNAIDNLPNLTPDQKKAAKAAIDNDANKAKTNIDNATTPADAKKADQDGTNDIHNDVKDNVKKDIDKGADNAKAKIDNMGDLTPDQKKDAKAKIDQDANDAKKATDAATNGPDAAAAGKKGDQDVFNDAKKAAHQDIDNAVQKDKDKIDHMDNLTPDEKQKAKDRLDSDAKKAHGDLDKSDNLDDMGNAVQTGYNSLTVDVKDNQTTNDGRNLSNSTATNGPVTLANKTQVSSKKPAELPQTAMRLAQNLWSLMMAMTASLMAISAYAYKKFSRKED